MLYVGTVAIPFQQNSHILFDWLQIRHQNPAIVQSPVDFHNNEHMMLLCVAHRQHRKHRFSFSIEIHFEIYGIKSVLHAQRIHSDAYPTMSYASLKPKPERVRGRMLLYMCSKSYLCASVFRVSPFVLLQPRVNTEQTQNETPLISAHVANEREEFTHIFVDANGNIRHMANICAYGFNFTK